MDDDSIILSETKKKMRNESIDYDIPRCIVPATRVQAICRNMCSLTFTVASVILFIYSFFTSKRISDRCISILMTSLTLLWISIGMEKAINHIVLFAKLAMSLMFITIGLLLVLPSHVASLEVCNSGIYEKGMFFGVKISIVLLFFVAAFWFLAWTCFVADQVLRKAFFNTKGECHE